MTSKHPTKSTVHLSAFDRAGRQVFTKRLTIHSFYENSHPVLDDPEYRKACQIVRVSGVIYSAEGAISQEFDLRFNLSGLCVGDAARFADGSLAGPWDELQNSRA